MEMFAFLITLLTVDGYIPSDVAGTLTNLPLPTTTTALAHETFPRVLQIRSVHSSRSQPL